LQDCEYKDGKFLNLRRRAAAIKKIGNSSPSGRFGARMTVFVYNELAQITKRPDGYLNGYGKFMSFLKIF
jgi:hypothetical protein